MAGDTPTRHSRRVAGESSGVTFSAAARDGPTVADPAAIDVPALYEAYDLVRDVMNDGTIVPHRFWNNGRLVAARAVMSTSAAWELLDRLYARLVDPAAANTAMPADPNT